MAESTLSLGYVQYSAEVGYQLGYGRDSANWGSVGTVISKYYHIDRIVQSAIRRVQTAWSWPWMRPNVTMVLWPSLAGTAVGDPDGGATLTATAAVFYSSMVGRTLVMDTSGNEYTITATNGTFTTPGTTATVSVNFSGETSGDTFTVTATGDYRLPDNFGHMIGLVTFGTDESYLPGVRTSDQAIRTRRQFSIGESAPSEFAVRFGTTAGVTGQRADLMVWPVPDEVYNATFRHAALPDKLDETNVYPLGGESVSELYMKACLAEAEFEANRARGQAEKDFKDALADAVAFHRNNEADTVGVLPSAEGTYPQPYDYRHGVNTQATYNGVSYP